jgi:two-component system, LytTR family, response regulator
MRTYTAVIVDDEVHQQELLSSLLKQNFPGIAIEAIIPSVPEALTRLTTNPPDLVFLDIMLPPFTGFDLLQQLPRIDFEIIFTTSYQEFAIKAFRLSAVDYLLKPVAPAELQIAMDRFFEKVTKKSAINHLELLIGNLQLKGERQRKIALPTLTGYVFVAFVDIIRCESDNTYTTFHLKDKTKIIVSKTLKDCEALLTDYSFFRVHNSHLINLDYIVEYTRGEGGVVKMSDGSHVDVSRRRKDEFVNLIKGGKSASYA